MNIYKYYKMKYYLIHNLDENRGIRMINCFEKSNINNNDVSWLTYPNKEDITDDIIRSYGKEPTYLLSELRGGSFKRKIRKLKSYIKSKNRIFKS